MIMKNHSDMNFNLIISLSRVAAFMFEWVKLVIKHVKIKNKLYSLGIKQVEDKISFYTQSSKKMIKIFEDILTNQQF